MTATCRYYLLQASNLSAPSKPTQNPPGGNWDDTEPSYTSGSTNTLYFVDLTVFSDGTWVYSSVSKSSAYEAAKEAYNKAQQVMDTVDGLTKIQDGEVLIDGDKVYLSAAFVRSIFAQDITATGTITGAQLIGAILSGNAIDISAGDEYSTMRIEGKKEHASAYDFCTIRIENKRLQGHTLGASTSFIEFDGETGEIVISAPIVTIDDSSALNPSIYTSFPGSVVSDGTVTVTKKLGMCFLNGGITLTAAASGWVTLLDSNAVAAPQNGEAIIMTLPSWKAPTTNPARLRIPANGGLQITRGSANAFWINLTYPIN